MKKITRIATHPGTCTSTVIGIMDRLNVETIFVSSPKQLEKTDFDGLLLLGGTDISPFFYGEKNHFSQIPDDNRDYIEWNLLRQAMTQKLPTLGICRGHQMITIAHGGSLYQDMYRQSATIDHPSTHHVLYSGKLANYAASNHVNSLHHQAVRMSPAGFKTLAKSPDGIIESIWKPGILGVQWHPEIMYQYDQRWINLFRWFSNGLE